MPPPLRGGALHESAMSEEGQLSATLPQVVHTGCASLADSADERSRRDELLQQREDRLVHACERALEEVLGLRSENAQLKSDLAAAHEELALRDALEADDAASSAQEQLRVLHQEYNTLAAVRAAQDEELLALRGDAEREKADSETRLREMEENARFHEAEAVRRLQEAVRMEAATKERIEECADREGRLGRDLAAAADRVRAAVAAQQRAEEEAAETRGRVTHLRSQLDAAAGALRDTRAALTAERLQRAEAAGAAEEQRAAAAAECESAGREAVAAAEESARAAAAAAERGCGGALRRCREAAALLAADAETAGREAVAAAEDSARAAAAAAERGCGCALQRCRSIAAEYAECGYALRRCGAAAALLAAEAEGAVRDGVVAAEESARDAVCSAAGCSQRRGRSAAAADRSRAALFAHEATARAAVTASEAAARATPPARRYPYLGMDISDGIRTCLGERYTQSGSVLPGGGVVVVQVDPSGPAAAAGIRQGDVVTAVGGTGTPDKPAFKAVYSRLAPGDVAVQLFRRSRTGYDGRVVYLRPGRVSEAMGRFKERVDYRVEFAQWTAPQLQTERRRRRMRESPSPPPARNDSAVRAALLLGAGFECDAAARRARTPPPAVARHRPVPSLQRSGSNHFAHRRCVGVS
eukprot:TRINITY_DN4849_c0_g1_i2.p1 TRINITY_DN4849_c0_g1~~TRINITY_DN4849_c0_g1_i2.p1  ORF type:complete len:647 (+),score=214.49 TRINITY_DN4849_c0_g1_i2:68-2008(+)